MPEHPQQFAIEGHDGVIRLSPLFYPNTDSAHQSGDLSHFAATGNAVYGYQVRDFDPFKIGPTQEPTGGVLFFSNKIKKEDFMALARILGMGTGRDYAAFLAESKNPSKDGYLRQLRLTSALSLRFHFEELTEEELDKFPEQTLTMPEALWTFIEHEKKEWGTFFGSPKLEGQFGGDSYFAREELSFGIMVENDFDRIYRIWSRAWLVTM
ncbi:MAG: hypothetical protein M1607_02080 [Patescibacteria group bacterium]|nr:hypothetical protein [Patescibacteria group bacterium]